MSDDTCPSPVYGAHHDEYEGFLRFSGHSERTIDCWLRYLRRFDREVGLGDADAAAVLHWLSNESWSAGTRKGARTALRSWYRWAHSAGVVAVDPTEKLPKIKVRRSMPRPAPDAVWSAAWERAQTWQQQAFLLLACHAGLRRTEIAAFHRDWIEGDCLRVQGKGGKTRIVPMSAELAEHLGRWPNPGEDYLCPGRWGGHVEPSYVGKRLSRLMGPGWSGHTLRHRAATMAYEESRDLAAVQDMLGHDSPETTRIYTRVTVEHVREAVQAGAARSSVRVTSREFEGAHAVVVETAEHISNIEAVLKDGGSYGAELVAKLMGVLVEEAELRAQLQRREQGQQ